MRTFSNFFKGFLLTRSPSIARYSSQENCLSFNHLKPYATAIVTLTIAPGQAGQIKFQGSWWTARCEQGLTLIPGKVVHVISRQNLTLYVEPLFSIAPQGN